MSSESSTHKTAIICQGGGMRSSHGAGFLYAVFAKLHLRPDILVGTSGNASSVLYATSGQLEDLRFLWEELLCSSKVASLTHPWKIINVDYVVDHVARQQLPINIDSLKQSPIMCYVSATNAETGKTRYISQFDGEDIFEVARATAAIPVFYNRKVQLSDGWYVDGELGPTSQDHVDFVVSQGATRIIVVNDAMHLKPSGRFARFLSNWYRNRASLGLRSAIDHDRADASLPITAPAGVDVITVSTVPFSVSTRNPHKLRWAFNHGISDALYRQDEILELFDQK